MVGVGSNKFGPDVETSRAMLVTILWRYEGSPNVRVMESFDDVKSDAYYAKAVQWAQKNGIVSGVGDNRFDPNASITREQIVTILYRYAQYRNDDLGKFGNLSKYKDRDKISDYALDAMEWAVGNGIVNGVSSDKLDPRGKATRAQIAQLMYRLDD